MAIPKIVHLCWFGGAAMNSKVRACVQSARMLANHGYEIRLWDESNYDISRVPCLERAYSLGKWSLVSNYARLDVLARYGGVYLDTDVEVVKPLDDLLHNDLFIGFVWDCTLGTAVIGSVPGHKIVKDILEEYDGVPGSLKSPNNDTFTDYFIVNLVNFRLNGHTQTFDGVRVLEKQAFEHPSLFKRENYTIHHFEQSWKAQSATKALTKALVIRCCSLWLYRKYVCWKSLRISPYYQLFRRAYAAEHAADPRKLGARRQRI